MAKTYNKRLIFALVWSALSVLGFLIYVSMTDYYMVGYFLGFDFIKDSLKWSIFFGAFSDYPQLMLIFLILEMVFINLWIVSLIRINKSSLFEWLIVVDNAISLITYSVLAIIQLDDFVFWYRLIGILIESIVVILLLILFFKKKAQRNTVDDSLS